MEKNALDAFRDVCRAFLRDWSIIVVCSLLAAVLALCLSLLQTPQYQSTAILYVTSGTVDDSQSAYQGSLASQQRVASYARLADSDVILKQAIESSGLDLSVEGARQRVSATSSVNTVLLSVAAVTDSPDESVRLSNGVAKAMIAFVTELETPARGGNPLAKLTLVSPATENLNPVEPKVSRNCLLGILAGLLLGLTVVLVRLRFDSRLRTVEDVESAAGAAPLAVIPADEEFSVNRVTDFHSGANRTAEAFRKLRTNLELLGSESRPGTIVITSPGESEGKTTVSLNLGASLAEAGQKVIVVDGDLRRGGVGSAISLSSAVGFMDYLRGGLSITDVIQRSDIGQFDILAVGTPPPNPAEVLGSARVGRCLAELADMYDTVVIDTPPTLPVTDAVVVSRWADGVLVVIRAGKTKSGDLYALKRELASGGAPILGYVVNSDAESGLTYGYYSSTGPSDATGATSEPMNLA